MCSFKERSCKLQRRICGSQSVVITSDGGSSPLIPGDVFLSEILPLLPLPQIYELRCVCRSWCAQLSNSFVDSRFRDADEGPWLVFARLAYGQQKGSSSRMQLSAYIPSAHCWFPFPLPFPGCRPAVDVGKQRRQSSAGGADLRNNHNISSLLGPGLQNTHPCHEKSSYSQRYPLVASAEGLVCSVVYDDTVVDSNISPLPHPRVGDDDPEIKRRGGVIKLYNQLSASNWASLLLLNPVTGKILIRPLPLDPILPRVSLSLSIVQVFDDNSTPPPAATAAAARICRYYVVLCPIKNCTYSADPRHGMWIYDIQEQSWKQNISSFGYVPLRGDSVIYFSKDRDVDRTSIHIADGRVYEISRDADIVGYHLNKGRTDYLMDYGIGRVDASTNGMAYLFGYSIEKNVWMVAYVPEPGDRHLEIDDFVVWKDGASHRIFLANCSRPCSRELVCPLAAHSHVGTPPSKCTGLDIWELKCYQASDHVSSHANPHVRHYWHHLSRSPSKMWRSFHGSPDEYFNCCDVMFTTSGSTVCVSAGDYLYNYPDDDKYPATVGRRHVCRLVYDVLLDTWSELPPTPIPSSPTERCLGAVPLFAFQPCFHDTF